MTHGLTAYANGTCRCKTCKAANARYQRRYRRGLRFTATRGTRAYFMSQTQDRHARLTQLGAALLDAACARTGKTVDDVLEALLRRCADHVEFSDGAAA